ncbi:UDP-N-acetylmuramoyl-tripeptide--D-alanyl-D-alanine ligase [Cellulophaga sp. Hel_I_12]|uniref:UDP-N-acetylmuramoyl-tripeptide--D-alanyl-D- alanine ligase n=1 Tax=Cellulophaga sp. Hel_I_12 TaxID=1249972 RepID=UPI0006466283|nr:UDP-N-acetylmuramoyl-tripeptide--D-alanyl-D-alanine ligase [Cellulophaga sp. Hel_I_12]
MNIEKLYELFLQFPNVSTDTRKITKDCLFFALKGDHFNGNSYAQQAIEKGAAFAIVDEEAFAHHPSIILVQDSLETLQQLANFHRKKSKAKIISLTGSNGKTTTKELISSVLATSYKTIATVGNLNNHIGVPLTLLSIKKNTEIAIIEMGANHQKEIEFLCAIAEPDFGYITNFGKAHLEGFGGVEGVIKGKSELYNFIIEQNRTIFFNADDAIQVSKLNAYEKKYGFSQEKNEYHHIKYISADPFVKLQFEDKIIHSKLIGVYNFVNCCAAILMGSYFKVSFENIKKGIENYIPVNNRSQIIDKNGHQIILDAYNANPSSMIVALENFKNLNVDPKIIFLGDMFELGETAPEEHQAIVDLASSMRFDTVFLIGKNFAKTKNKEQTFETFEALASFLEKNPIPKSNILIKGSRGMALERLLELL